MKLYYSRGACSLVVRIVINEIGLQCEYESVDLQTKKTEMGGDFLSINPKGSVPTLQLDNGEIMTENAVIQQYLVDSAKATQLLPACGDFKRYRVLEALNYITTDIHKGFAPLFNPAMPETVKKDIFIPKLKNCFAYENKQLGKNKFLMGDHFTLADAYLFVTLFWASKLKIDLSEFTHLTKYFTELKTRKSIEQSLNEEKLG